MRHRRAAERFLNDYLELVIKTKTPTASGGHFTDLPASAGVPLFKDVKL